MEATSITQTKNMIIDQIKQALPEKIEHTGAKIHDVWESEHLYPRIFDFKSKFYKR